MASKDPNELPETRFAQSGDVSIAYQVLGNGPANLIVVPGIMSHVEAMHEFAGHTDWLRRLARFSRVVTFDKRGQGLSDRVAGAPTLEERADDIRAVMDEIGMQQAAVVGVSEGTMMSAFFAAAHLWSQDLASASPIAVTWSSRVCQVRGSCSRPGSGC